MQHGQALPKDVLLTRSKLGALQIIWITNQGIITCEEKAKGSETTIKRKEEK